MNLPAISSVGELLDEVRHGRAIVLVDDRDESRNEGVVMVAAEHCEPRHVTFMARQARGLVCLALTSERCRQLDLPPMVEGDAGEKARFTLSIEAARGIDTGISAADRAHTIRVAVAPQAVPADIVQPGHVFPLTAEPGGVLIRAGQTEAAVDYTRIAGLTPAAVIADILGPDGAIAGAARLGEFAREHGLKVGTIADLIHYRIANERTIERLREGTVNTRFGEFRLHAYRDTTRGGLHLALVRGEIDACRPTLVRVHVSSTLRDVLGTRVQGAGDWNVERCLGRISDEGEGVLVLLARSEGEEQLLESVDLALGERSPVPHQAHEIYNTVGLGSQILRDLGVGKIRLMGAAIKYNAISGFGLEVCETLTSGDAASNGSESHE